MAQKRYDIEVTRLQNLHERANNQIGFAGVIIAIFSFIFGSNGINEIMKSQYFVCVVFGLILILGSIFTGIFVVFHKKNRRPAINPEKFYNKYKEKTEEEQKEVITLVYFDLIYYFKKRNDQKAEFLSYGNILALFGLLVSLISILFIIKGVG
ncbi:MAG: hypothetical protein ACREAR_03960 [Nitrosotalea sp.]